MEGKISRSQKPENRSSHTRTSFAGPSAPRRPPPKPARRTQREAVSDAPTDKPPPRPKVKGRQKPPAPVPSPQDGQPAANQSGDDAIIQPLDLGREHEGIPHGWSPAYWRYVTVSIRSSYNSCSPSQFGMHGRFRSLLNRIWIS